MFGKVAYEANMLLSLTFKQSYR